VVALRQVVPLLRALVPARIQESAYYRVAASAPLPRAVLRQLDSVRWAQASAPQAAEVASPRQAAPWTALAAQLP
jgi:hypothetical protein